MINPVLEWALQVLQHPQETSVDSTVSKALNLVGISPGQIQINSQPLESIFSKIGESTSSVIKKKIPWQELDVEQIVYPVEHAAKVVLDVPEPPQGWDRFHTNENLALALIEKYGTFLSISSQIPYISFYDVIKSAAAIHDCLESGKTDKPFLLASGDFSGIQETIYTIASSGALKTLRARSFMLELLAEHIIYEIQQATSSGRYSLIFSGGGGFSLLVPNTTDNRKSINTFINIINEWILEQFGFQLFLAVHCETVCEKDLTGDPFKIVWETMADKMNKQKERKFWDTTNFKNLFRPEMPKQLANQSACQITHRDDLPDCEMAPEEVPGVGRVSKFAYRLWTLGDRLTEFDCIVRLPKSSTLTDDFKGGTLLFPTFDSQYAEYKTDQQSQISSNHDAQWVVNSWNLANYKDNKTFPFLFGSYVRSVDGLPDEAQEQEREEYLRDHEKPMSRPERVTASFSGLAKAAQGSDLIGCLRMDVDNFGDLFSDKLTSSGIAAISNLSRSMNLFFKGYLNQICGMKLGELEKKDHPVDITGKKKSKINGRDVSIIYAGGDDLFIVGAWDDVAELVFDINTCFREFSGYNPEVHLSGGVTLHKSKFPLYQMARIAKQAEEAAKRNEDQSGETKNSLALFYSDTLERRNRSLNDRIKEENLSGWHQKLNRIAVASQWDGYDDIIQLTKQMYKTYPSLSHGFRRKLFETLIIWQEEGVLYLPIMFHTLQQIDRIQPQPPALKSLKGLLFRQDQMEKLHVPLHWVEYLNR
ncbi:MAG: type III-A CRISPR-associated protein Cas10/Csm1 [Candidatus Poribacteria bacterium]|nr:type III-A CRISPR-associated protein Cas10/Csm1 [Candidatus Poribacteria bacterium]